MLGLILATVIKLLPLGDSITEGSNNQANYRIPLCQKLEANGVQVETVGFRSIKNVDGRGSRIPQRWWSHTGISGQRVISGNGRAGYLDSILPLLDQAGNDVDVVVFMIGTNDLLRNCPVEEAFNGFKTLLDRLRGTYNQSRIIVCTILDMPGKTEQVNDYNQRIKALVETLPRNQVFLADLNAQVVRENGDYLDSLHPNWQGHDHTSSLLCEIILKALKAPRIVPNSVKIAPSIRDRLKSNGYRLAQVMDLPMEGGFKLPEIKAKKFCYLLELKRPGKNHKSRFAVAYPFKHRIVYEPDGYGKFQAWDGDTLIFAFNRFAQDGVNEIGISTFEQHYLGDKKYSRDYTYTWETPTMNAGAYEVRRLEVWKR